MEKRQKLPIGIHTFEKLREKKCLYIDKTKFLVDIIDNEEVCCLARPRRFGKSLTISTFEALFSGKKELFEGLYAEEFMNRPDYQTNPVIRLDMSAVVTNRGITELENTISKQVKDVANKLGVSLSDSYLPGMLLEDLITNTANKYNQKVVILLDEYDKPYTDFVNDPEMAEKVRESLRNFYIQIKAKDEYISFTFITGISKFAKFGVFSTLNTPLDISMMPEYAEICGYTEDELIKYFPDYIEDTAKYMQISTEKLIDEMRNYYNGFCFDSETKTRLYNPYSSLTFFKRKEFLNYWMDTGRSKMIADYMKNKKLTVEQFRNVQVERDFAQNPGDMDTASAEGFLYQGGYLTLRPGIADTLTLDYPNTEVLNSMSKLLTQNIFENDINYYQANIRNALRDKNIEKFVKTIDGLLANIPYKDYVDSAERYIELHDYKIPAHEWLYRSTILAFIRGCGINVIGEMQTNLGRPDLVIFYNNITWVIEIKIAYEGDCPQKKLEEALQQIKEKNYSKPFPEAICIGMVIDDEKRKIAECKVN